MASAIGILDSNADCLISRTYTTDLLPLRSIFENFKHLLQSDQIGSPILKSQEYGVNYIYIKSNDIMLLCITYFEHVNCMTLMHFLYKLKEILSSYFKTTELNKDLIIDNFNLIYELFDEVMDFGIPQFTEYTILRDFIKLELNESEIPKDKSIKDVEIDDYINTSILRTTTSNISWRPKGIFYKKNEFFVDIDEKITMIMNSKTNKIVKHEIHGDIKIKSYLSGMPILKIGLNKTNLEKFQWHQCVELPKFHTDKIISFIPPDGKFILGSYTTPIKTPPIIQILNLEYIPKTPQKLILKLSIRTNFKHRAALHNVKFLIPLELNKYNIDKSETPLFKTKIGKVFYKIDQDCILWEIDTIGGDREFTMMALLQLIPEIPSPPKELGMDPPPRRTTPRIDKLQQELDEIKQKNKDVEIKFKIPDIAWSGLKVDYLKIEEEQLKYPSFPWVRYSTVDDEYIYRL